MLRDEDNIAEGRLLLPLRALPGVVTWLVIIPIKVWWHCTWAPHSKPQLFSLPLSCLVECASCPWICIMLTRFWRKIIMFTSNYFHLSSSFPSSPVSLSEHLCSLNVNSLNKAVDPPGTHWRAFDSVYMKSLYLLSMPMPCQGYNVYFGH